VYVGRVNVKSYRRALREPAVRATLRQAVRAAKAKTPRH
jgi:hypothetical protein